MRLIISWTVLSTILCLLSYGCQEQAPKAEVPHVVTPEANIEAEVEPITTKPVEVINLSDQVPLFVVIAGAYSSEGGALSKSEDLKKLGYSNAGVIQRPGSKLYSALVERFDNQQDADAFADQLKTDQEIKSYVYKVK